MIRLFFNPNCELKNFMVDRLEHAERAKQSALRLREQEIQDKENWGIRTHSSLNLAERIEKASHSSF